MWSLSESEKNFLGKFHTIKLFQLDKAKLCWSAMFFQVKLETTFTLNQSQFQTKVKHRQIAASRTVLIQHSISFSRVGSKELCYIYSDMVDILTKVQFAHFSQKESFYHIVKRCATGIKKVVMRCATNSFYVFKRSHLHVKSSMRA